MVFPLNPIPSEGNMLPPLGEVVPLRRKGFSVSAHTNMFTMHPPPVIATAQPEAIRLPLPPLPGDVAPQRRKGSSVIAHTNMFTTHPPSVIARVQPAAIRPPLPPAIPHSNKKPSIPDGLGRNIIY